MKTAQNIEVAPHTESAPTIIRSLSKRWIIGDVAVRTSLAVMAIIWLVPIARVLIESFNKGAALFTKTFFPAKLSLDNYVKFLTDRTVMDFLRIYLNTFVIACFIRVISVLLVLMIVYVMSHMRFRLRRTFMSVVLILGMSPDTMAISAIHFILKAIGMTGGGTTILALILVYSAGSGVGFYVIKGYMDTIPSSLNGATVLDGCTHSQVFWKIILPTYKPMVMFQAITGFLGPWLGFVMIEVTVRTQSDHTVTLDLRLMLKKEYIHSWFACFAAGVVLVSIPTIILFIIMQRFYQESMSGSVKD